MGMARSLASNGSSQPEAELAATLVALYAPSELGNQHAQCVFPARSRWLQTQLKLQDLPKPSCSEFNTWYQDIAPHSAVLIYPAAYLNSPSSMFGHTLLRIDTPDQNEDTRLLAYAVNYAAQTNTSNGLEFAYKGLEYKKAVSV